MKELLYVLGVYSEPLNILSHYKVTPKPAIWLKCFSVEHVVVMIVLMHVDLCTEQHYISQISLEDRKQ